MTEQLTTTDKGFELLGGAAELGRTGLTLSRDLTFAEWTNLGVAMQRVESGLQWALGDWLNYGEAKYGEKYAQAVEAAEATGRNVETLRVAQWVAERVPVVLRRTTLSWSHHKEVAALEPSEQDALLQKAEERALSVSALREAVRTFKAQLASGSTEPETPEPTRELPVKVTVSTSKEPEGSKPELVNDEPFQDDVDPIAEWERAEKELEEARRIIEALTKDDLTREIRAKAQHVAQLEARINGLLNEKKAAVDQAQYGEKKLKEIRKLLGVERDREIIDAIKALQLKVA